MEANREAHITKKIEADQEQKRVDLEVAKEKETREKSNATKSTRYVGKQNKC